MTLDNIDKEELHNIGECLLDCIISYRHDGGFHEHCYWFDGKRPWSYHKDKYLIKVVCELFDLDYDSKLQDYGYEMD